MIKKFNWSQFILSKVIIFSVPGFPLSRERRCHIYYFMKDIIADKNQIALCGLYCGACKKFLSETCPGCAQNEKAGWCKVRTCCLENNYSSCADCKKFDNIEDCKKLNNFIAKIFGLVFRSDRNACIAMIKEKGYEDFALYMAKNKLQSLKR